MRATRSHIARSTVCVAIGLIMMMRPIAAGAEPLPEPYYEGIFSEAPVAAPDGSKCPELYEIALANWPSAREDWGLLDRIFYRESRCRPEVVNRYGCVGLMQICRGNIRRLGESRYSLQDAATNIATGYRLCMEWVDVGRSCWRPWWARGFRP